jgi:predicted N-acetyltransferase YhbS
MKGGGRVLIRDMWPEDIPAGERLCRSSGWNQVAPDWALFLELNPAGCRVAEKHGQLIGTVASIRYQHHFDWLAMILVDPSERHMGIGTRLLEEGLAAAEGAGCVRLDATAVGRRIYRKYGFEDEYTISRLTRNARASASLGNGGARPVRVQDFPAIFELDRVVFGADREAVLRSLFARSVECAWLVEDSQIQGYCFGRDGFLYHQIGPIVANDVSVARELVSACLNSSSANSYVIDAPTLHSEWLEWLAETGFGEERSFTRMSRGEREETDDLRQVFGVAGPELG